VAGLVVNNGRPARVLLTGATGFIGSHLARLLVGEGHEVAAIVRPNADRWRIADIEPRLRLIVGDLRCFGHMRQDIRAHRPEICVHLAWQGWSGRAEAEANLSSLAVSLEVLRAMVELSCDRFVAAGTCFEYDLSYDRLSESTPLRPHDLYGACKKSLFEVAQPFSALTGVSVATARIFYSYGPFEDARRLVPSITRALLRGEEAKVTRGEQVRDYLHVSDIVSAIWHLSRGTVTGAVNVASGEAVTIADMARRIAAMLGREDLLQLGALPYRDGEPMHIVADPSRLRCDLGWKPAFDLAAGLADTVAWWRRQVAVGN
jgi:nucleoside-diphosphate-sugar epimerase